MSRWLQGGIYVDLLTVYHARQSWVPKQGLRWPSRLYVGARDLLICYGVISVVTRDELLARVARQEPYRASHV